MLSNTWVQGCQGVYAVQARLGRTCTAYTPWPVCHVEKLSILTFRMDKRALRLLTDGGLGGLGDGGLGCEYCKYKSQVPKVATKS
jgi:hypothetical protein